MRASDWLIPGIGIRRWSLLLVVGLSLICLGVISTIRYYSKGALFIILMILMAFMGVATVIGSLRALINSILKDYKYKNLNTTLNSEGLSNLLHEKRILVKGPKIVAVGGGTGLSTMLRGLKQYTSNLTALVTVADDGGGSGVLREDLGMLPPGDIRNCILALADTEPIMQKLLQYRFQDGMLKGQSFGNLFLAAMDGISESFEEAVKKMSDVLAVTGKVLPITLEDVRLCADIENGETILGEYNIGHREGSKARINRVFLNQSSVKPLKEAIDAIMEADIVVLGPGSLYTSIIPNLLVDGVCDALQKTKGIIVYVCNVMTQPCETEGYTLSDHIRAIEKHSRKGIIDFCVVNTAPIPDDLSDRYKKDGAELVRVDSDVVEKMGIEIITGDFKAINNNYVRHDSNKLAKKIIELVSDLVLSKDKERILDYYYSRDRINKIG